MFGSKAERWLRHGLAVYVLMAATLVQAGELVLAQSLQAPDGLTRWFHYYRPDNLPARAPVVILLHGGTLSYNKVIDQTRSNVQRDAFGRLDTSQWVDLAEEDKFLLLIPNGVNPSDGDTQGESQSWNDCRNADEASAIETGADDVGFLSALIDWAAAQADFEVDLNRVYVTGHSNGGTMSYRAAAELGERVAAFAAFIANLPVDPGKECQAPTFPVSAFLLHSTADPVMDYAGGCDTTTGPRGCTHSAEATRDFWIALNDAGEAQMPVVYPNLDDKDGTAAGGSTASSVLYSGGRQGTEVLHMVVEGGGHNGPSVKYRLTAGSEATTGLQNHDVDGVRHAWEFLKSKSLNSAATLASAQDPQCEGSNVSIGPAVDRFTTRPAVFPWQGNFLQDDVICFRSRQSGAQLRGYLFAPNDVNQRQDQSLPVVVMGPGSGSSQALYHIWAARELAGHGYLVLVEDPQGAGRSEINGVEPEGCDAGGCPGIPFQQALNYVDGLLSGTDFVFSRGHSWLRKADLTRVGLAGHSLSARAASYLGGLDERIKAVVAWDNLSSDLYGDAGVSSGGGACGAVIGGEPPGSLPVTIRVPSLGQASDLPGSCTQDSNPDAKKSAYARWRQAGVPSMQLVFAGARHADWAQSAQSDSQQLELFQYYSRAWFDLYLRGDESARARLIDPQILLSQTALTASAVLSQQFRSAAFMPEARIDCADLAANPCVPTLNQPPVAVAVSDLVEGLAPLNVSFDAAASSDPDGDTLHYIFDFGDGTPIQDMTQPNANHSYAAGEWVARIQVQDRGGLLSLNTVSLQIRVTETPPESADETAADASAAAPGSASPASEPANPTNSATAPVVLPVQSRAVLAEGGAGFGVPMLGLLLLALITRICRSPFGDRRALTPLLGLVLSACADSTPVETAAVNSSTPLIMSSATCQQDSWVAGSTELCAGRFVYRDYIYDDYGANTGEVVAAAPGTSSLSATSGDKRYPAGAENTADLVRFELWLEGDQIKIEVELNTLYSADQTLAAVALDTDNDAATGSETLLGLRVSGADWVQQITVGDPQRNLLRGSFPRPPGATWKIWAVTAQADGTVMNVAFRGTQETASTDGAYWENNQAAALNAGDITAYSATVDLADLEGGVTQPALPALGFQQRVYTSAYTLPPGEGISVEGVPGRHGRTGSGCEQYFHYLGKYQPYGVYVPEGPGPKGLVVVLHGCDANHSSQVRQDGFQAQFGDGLDSIIVAPLGRGTLGWFSDISERDVLDVMDDAQGQLQIDSERVVMTGYSMGGYGSMRMAAFYPDKFSAAVSWVGNTGSLYNTPVPGNPVTTLERESNAIYEETTGTQIASGDSGAIGDVLDFLGNLSHVPFAGLYAAADYLVPVHTALTLEQRLNNNSELVFDFYLHPAAEHLTFALLDTWQKEAAFVKERRREHQPAQIRYRFDTRLYYPEYGIRHDRAYWVSNLRVREEGIAELDLRSRACGFVEPLLLTGQDADPAAVPLPWLRSFRRAEPGTPPMPTIREDFIEGELSNVSNADIDLRGACLEGRGFRYRLSSDGPVTLQFSDGRLMRLEGGTAEGVFE